VKSEKLRGFLAKMRDLTGLTGIDPGRLDLDTTAASGSILSGYGRSIRIVRS
jgi:hypothetical protein